MQKFLKNITPNTSILTKVTQCKKSDNIENMLYYSHLMILQAKGTKLHKMITKMLTHVTQCTSAKRTLKAIDKTLQYLQINCIIITCNEINQLSHRLTL
jgi:5S rRNA maturation endonuclease (ribonuclease M5)